MDHFNQTHQHAAEKMKGIEETPLEEIAETLKLIDNVEALHWFIYGSGLSKTQRSLAWQLLPFEERRRLKPIFDQLKTG